MKKEKLDEILSLHKKWLSGAPDGVRANLRGAYLREANLSGADLRGAYLREANLREAYLRGADMSWADLRGAYLREANLSEADLRGADLSGADLRGAYLREANLSEANLREANLREANLREADLREANMSWANLRGANMSWANMSWADMSWADLREAYLRGADLSGASLSEANLRRADLRGAKGTDTVITNESTAFFRLQCPEAGAYTAYKKAHGLIVELEIPADALRSSATSRKCRASKAKVISITNKDGSAAGVEEVESDHDAAFVYRVGETVSVPDFDTDRWNECAAGIHHFITRAEAVQYA